MEHDLLGWHYNENGLYSVKSGYWLAIYPLITTSSPPTYGTVALKEKIWKAHVPAKLKHFLLRIESRSIVTGNNLRRRHVTMDVICKRCWLEEETEEHLFFNSPYAKKIWRTSRIANTIIDSLTTSYEDKLEACLQVSNVNDTESLSRSLYLGPLENLEVQKHVIISASTS